MIDYISILFIGDVVGKPGIDILQKIMPELKNRFAPSFIIINGENAWEGKGLSELEADIFFALGADVITTGNHIWDNWKSKPLLANNPKVIRPANYPAGNVGKGYCYHLVDDDFNFAVLQIQGRTFMQAIDCPFRTADNLLKQISEQTQNIIVDFHADATAEKIAMGWHLDGRVSAVLGTHTHIQTADAQILPAGTAYITDVGMTGPYDSVVGMKKEIALKRFILQTPHKYETAIGDERVSGVNLLINPSNGRAVKIEPFTVPGFNMIIK